MTDPHAEAKQQQAAATAATLTAVYTAMRADVLRRLREVGSILLPATWRDRLQSRVRERSLATIKAIAPSLDESRIAGKVDAYAKWFAATSDEVTRQALSEVDLSSLDLPAAVAEVLDRVIAASKIRADSLSVEMGNFAALEQATLEGQRTKTWRIQGASTRDTHRAISGETVGIGETFRNGLAYPGAPGPPEERINCDCYLTFGGG